MLFLVNWQIFFLVVVFGLFHGLIILPMILSFIGPKPYEFKTEQVLQEKQEMKELEQTPSVPMPQTEKV